MEKDGCHGIVPCVCSLSYGPTSLVCLTSLRGAMQLQHLWFCWGTVQVPIVMQFFLGRLFLFILDKLRTKETIHMSNSMNKSVSWGYIHTGMWAPKRQLQLHHWEVLPIMADKWWRLETCSSSATRKLCIPQASVDCVAPGRVFLTISDIQGVFNFMNLMNLLSVQLYFKCF